LETNIELILKEIKKGASELLPEDEFRKKLEKSIKTNTPLKIKFGADPSSSDLHIGHAVCLNKLRILQDFGHRVDLIIGDFTARIGDPTGKSKTRKMLTEEDVVLNAKTYTDQAFKILDKDKTTIYFNNDWLGKMSFKDIIYLTSKYTVARLLERDDFSNRYKNGIPISVLEFLYPLAQGYDSVHLKSDLEIGGTDQKFNFLVARNLMSEYEVEPQCILTLPILVGLDGKDKMSKSLKNDVPITAKPFDMFGKILSIPDEIMFDYFRLATFLKEDEIIKLEEEYKENKVHPMDLKKKLALTIVSIYHNEEEAIKAKEEFEAVFSKKDLPTDIPLFEIKEDEITILNLIFNAKLISSKSEGKKLIQAGAVKIDQEKVVDINFTVKVIDDKVIQVGKRKFIKLKKN
jgi:tyrosyl-tRNA synthetase